MESNTEENRHIPIIIGNHSPFRIVTRKTDRWSPSLRQINKADYDYVKLNRLSTFIDIGIRPFSLGIAFDGSLILPAIAEFHNKENSLEKFNIFLGTLLLGGIYSESVEPENISYGTLFFDGYSKIHGGGTGYVANFHKSIRTKVVGLLDSIKLLKPKSLKIEEIEKSYSKGKKISDQIVDLSPKLLLDGTSNYVRQQWAESMIFLWTSIEQIINIIWKRDIIDIDISEPINGRKEFLKDFRTWTTSTKIELLYQKKIIPLSVYKFLNSARKSRNDFIHNGTKLNEEKVKNALEGLFKLISLTISNYKSTTELDNILKVIYKNQKGEFFPEKRTLKIDEVSHWLAIPAIPGDRHWGNKKYEIIQELVLQPLNGE